MPYSDLDASEHGKYALATDDLLIARLGSVGRAARVREPNGAVYAGYLVRFCPDRARALPAFLGYQLQSPDWWEYVEAVRSGAVQPTLNAKQMAAYSFSLPPLSEQHKIAEVLGALDDKIEANRITVSIAQRHTSAAFEATTAELVTADVPLFDVVEFVFGESFKSSDFNMEERGRPLIRIRDLKTFRPQFWTTESRPRETVVKPGDIVVGMDAEFRPTLWCGAPGLLNQRVCMARPRMGGRAFVRELLEEPLAQVESFKTGTTVSHLNKVDLESIKVSLPKPAAIMRFDDLAEPLREATVALHRENRDLAALRDTLLPKLLSGELWVREAEDLVEQAV
ncbi:MAG: restriction endonuclease subunit S [Nitrososphaerales archaeon]